MPPNLDLLLNDVRSALDSARLGPNDVMVVGFSGGVDSQTLLHSLTTLRDSGVGPRIQAIHVDHRLREGSEQDAHACVRIAQRMSVPIDVIEVDVQVWNRGRGVEAAARDARFAALANAAVRFGTSWVSVGHTLDDQVETVLMRLARGTSLDGLTAMRETTRRMIPLASDNGATASIYLLRPLLRRTRAEIEQYADECGLTPIEDPTNADPRFRRNAVRHQLLPLLEQIEPGSRHSIARSISLLAADAAFLEVLGADAFEKSVSALGPCHEVDRAAFAQLPTPVQGRVVALLVHQLAPGIDLTSERVEAVCQAIRDGQVSTCIEVKDGIDALVDYDRVVIGRADLIESTIRTSSGLPLLDPASEFRIEGSHRLELRNGWNLDICCDDAKSEWLLRTRLPGDRVQLDGGPARKLQDWFVNQKVTRCLRDHIPLLVRAGEVRWIAGFSSPTFEDVDSGLTARLTKSTKEDRTDDERVSGHSST